MSAFIQQTETGLFFKAKGEWVESREAAQVFRDSQAAITFCVEQNIRDVRLLLVSRSGKEETFLYPFGNEGGGESATKRRQNQGGVKNSRNGSELGQNRHSHRRRDV